MRFLGTEADLKTLKDSQENVIETLLMNAYNEGFDNCNKSVTELYNQAVAAINQGLVGSVGEGNPFLNIVKVYVDAQKAMMASDVNEQIVEG